MSDLIEVSAIKIQSRAKLDSLIQQTPESKRQLFADEMKAFEELFHTYLQSRGKMIDWEKIHPPRHDLLLEYAELNNPQPSEIASLSKKLCVLKLNGGLGTTMGCKGPKSIIEVHSEKSFLDLTVEQIEYLNKTNNCDVPLILMNSFNTHDDTEKVIHKYTESKARILCFNQSRFPRMYKDNLLPVPDSPSYANKEAWYPPGHGDVFKSLYNSGILKQLIDEGKEYVFISNVDNLGATVDFNILKHIIEQEVEYCMEVTEKTRADVKGGTLIQYEGKAKLLEIAQVPPSKIDEFKSIKKFKIFNTNNLWVSLKAIERVVKEGLLKDIDVIVNHKKMDNGAAVIQLETAVGGAIQFFKNSIGISVKRSRFLPVKSCSDLFSVQSNLYDLGNGMLTVTPKRTFPGIPIVNLGDHFKTVSQYNSRFSGIPEILELDQLTVSGDVTFGANITLKGTVIIVANHGARIDIPPGTVLENKVVTGNLRILDH